MRLNQEIKNLDKLLDTIKNFPFLSRDRGPNIPYLIQLLDSCLSMDKINLNLISNLRRHVYENLDLLIFLAYINSRKSYIEGNSDGKQG